MYNALIFLYSQGAEKSTLTSLCVDVVLREILNKRKMIKLANQILPMDLKILLYDSAYNQKSKRRMMRKFGLKKKEEDAK
jgi:hypothetical protein